MTTVNLVNDVYQVTLSDQDTITATIADLPPHNHTQYAELDGAVFTGDVTAPNMTGVVSLADGANVPPGTPPGTLVARYTS